MKKAGLEDLIKLFKNGRIGIIGDFCLDAYWVFEAEIKQLSVFLANRPGRLLSIKATTPIMQGAKAIGYLEILQSETTASGQQNRAVLAPVLQPGLYQP